MVGLSAAQQILFSVLAQYKVFFPTPPYHVSYNDFSKRLPQFIFIWELTVVSVFFLFSFEFEPYLRAARSGSPVHASAGRALLQSYNNADIFYGLAYAFTGWHRKPRGIFSDPASLEMNEPSSHKAKDLFRNDHEINEAAAH